MDNQTLPQILRDHLLSLPPHKIIFFWFVLVGIDQIKNPDDARESIPAGIGAVRSAASTANRPLYSASSGQVHHGGMMHGGGSDKIGGIGAGGDNFYNITGEFAHPSVMAVAVVLRPHHRAPLQASDHTTISKHIIWTRCLRC